MNITNKLLLGTVMGMCTGSLLASNVPKERKEQLPQKPNIVLIMADDLGYAGLSCFGGQGISTPNLDSLASQGVKFTNFYSNSTVCSPTRVALLTGRYQQRVGLDHIYFHCLDDDGLDPEENQVLAKQFKNAGYHTGVFGKWHLGSGEKYRPQAHGFDEFVGFLDGNIDFISHHNTESTPDWWVDHKLHDQKGYATTLLNEAAVDFIERNHEKPFFLYMPEAAVHVPMQGPNDPALRTDDYYTYKVDHLLPKDEYMRRYSEMVASMDQGVGQIMNALRKYGIEDNTLIIFLSDNGGERVGAKHGRVNGKLRGYKCSMYEGGIKVPALCYWKNHLQGGRINNETMLSMDIYPTLMRVAGIPQEENFILDGVDLWNCIAEDQPLEERKLFWMHTDRLVMRDGSMKLIRQNGGVELYDLANDPQEKHNLAKQDCYAVRVAEMVAESDEWHKNTATGFPLEREIGVKVKTKWPCRRDLEKFNKGKKWEWNPDVNLQIQEK